METETFKIFKGNTPFGAVIRKKLLTMGLAVPLLIKDMIPPVFPQI